MSRKLPPLSVATRAKLFAHLAAMEQSGLPADMAFSLLHLPRAARARVDATRKLIARGIDPATAGRRGGLFGELEAGCLRAALAAGSPAATYRRLADHYAERVALACSIKSAMAVPLFTFVVALFPRPLPALVAGSLAAGGYLLQCIVPLLAAIGIFRLGKRLPHWLAGGAPAELRRQVEHALLRLPLVGAMTLRGNLRDFIEHLAILLEAGVPMFDALPLAEATVGNGMVRAECARIKPALLAGATLAQALAALPAIAGDQLVACVRTGEHSGCLPKMLFRYAATETAALSQLHRQAATWLPRALYALFLLWIGWGVLSSGAFMPHAVEPR
jgi:general secretion pathway protein F